MKKVVQRIERFPYSSRATKKPGVRVAPLTRYPYLIFYSVDENNEQVHILRIRHDAREPLTRLS